MSYQPDRVSKYFSPLLIRATPVKDQVCKRCGVTLLAACDCKHRTWEVASVRSADGTLLHSWMRWARKPVDPNFMGFTKADGSVVKIELRTASRKAAIAKLKEVRNND